MDSFSSFIRHPLIRLLLFSTLAFASGFGLAYRQDRIRAEEIGRLTWSHFSYAEELKDDMAVIDWSNDMKNLDGLRVFQADLNSKVIAEGETGHSCRARRPRGSAIGFQPTGPIMFARAVTRKGSRNSYWFTTRGRAHGFGASSAFRPLFFRASA